MILSTSIDGSNIVKTLLLDIAESFPSSAKKELTHDPEKYVLTLRAMAIPTYNFLVESGSSETCQTILDKIHEHLTSKSNPELIVK